MYPIDSFSDSVILDSFSQILSVNLNVNSRKWRR